jgi:outer membrane protein
MPDRPLRYLAGPVALIVVLLSSFSPATAAQEIATPLRLSLVEAADLALRDNPQAAMAEAGQEIARARLLRARSTWLPLVRVSETWTRGDNPVFVFGTLLEQGVFGPHHFDPAFLNDPPSIENYRLALDLQLPIFDQLRRVTSISQARLGVEQSDLEAEAARQTLRLETVRAYFGVLVAAKSLDVARDAVGSAEADVAAIRDRFETGLIVESDLLAAEVQLAEFRQQAIRAEGERAVAEARLRALLDLPPETVLVLTTRLPEQSFEPPPLEEQLRVGLERRPELARSDSATRVAALEVRRARGSWLPRLDGFATLGASGASIDEQNSDRIYGLALSFDLLRPGRLGEVAEAKASRRIAVAQHESAVNAVRVEIIAAWQELQAGRQSLVVAERSVEQSRETMRIIRDRYEQGLVTITEQLRAQTALVRAEMNLLAAQNDNTIAHARLLRATGRLDHVAPFIE